MSTSMVVTAHRYDPSNTTYVETCYICEYYTDKVEDRDPNVLFCTFPLSDLEVNQTNTSDDLRFAPECGPAYTTVVGLNVTINEDPGLLDNITITAEGYGTYDPENYTMIWIYNGTHFEKVSTDWSLEGTDNVTSYEVTTDFTRWIQGSEIYVLYTSEDREQNLGSYPLYTDYILLETYESTVQKAALQIMNDSYLDLGETINFSLELTNTTVPDKAFLQTNETGEWKDHSGVYGSPMDLKRIATNETNYSWSNTSCCNKVMGMRVHYNDTAGAWWYTETNYSYLMPFINGSTNVKNNISASACGNSSHINYTFSEAITGRMEVWLDIVMDGTNKTCPYNGTGFSSWNMTNETNYCSFKGALSDISIRKTYYISRWAAYEFEKPPNIPAAVASVSVTVIIIIVVYTRKRKSTGW